MYSTFSAKMEATYVQLFKIKFLCQFVPCIGKNPSICKSDISFSEVYLGNEILVWPGFSAAPKLQSLPLLLWAVMPHFDIGCKCFVFASASSLCHHWREVYRNQLSASLVWYMLPVFPAINVQIRFKGRNCFPYFLINSYEKSLINWGFINLVFVEKTMRYKKQIWPQSENDAGVEQCSLEWHWY